jgi:ABC-type amino acid transport system permease subunit
MRPGGGKRRARFILPALYLLLALYVWFDFAAAARDGLANLGLFAVTLPVSLLGLALGWLIGADAFVLLPDRFGYLADHAIYYVPAVAVTALLVWLLGRAIDRRPA